MLYSETMSGEIKIWVQEMNAYHMGHLVGGSIQLPTEDEEEITKFMEDLLQKSQVATGESTSGRFQIIKAENMPFKINSTDDLNDINHKLQDIEFFDEDELIALTAFLEDSTDFDSAVVFVNNQEYRVYNNCFEMEDVAREVAEEKNILHGCTPIAKEFFDYTAYGEYLEENGTYLYVSGNYVHLF
ncbi:antirestriction protein ArdA [Thermoactinomyces sp. DSM 45892]|uniref:antirestriction protein ArdA n=1 Tax=Thermoactinomyces sp. DSM 45892 TaxID=1882753 RepID=UPI0008987576|nr:antirestriction protein ArdA [Thermoactinomyces sp. DSM 45892]SDZ06330.1 Antirestriction protein (ArdA) [Thermoactinomyces sp. DSM 45892]